MSIYEDTILLIYTCVLTAMFGAVLGSFLNCAAWRIAHKESFLAGRSRCTVCRHTLGILDLVPVFSWLFLRGRCRYCKAKVSVRYILTECLFSVLTVLCVLRFDLSVVCLRNLVFLSCMFCLSLVDLEIYIIPNGCLLIAAIAWIVVFPLIPSEYGGLSGVGFHLLAAVLYGGGMLVLSLLMDFILKKESLGGGDIKLFAVMGLYLGFLGSMFALILSCIFGLLFAAVRSRVNKEFGAQIPFGPAIAAASWLMLLYGSNLVNWYMSLIIG